MSSSALSGQADELLVSRVAEGDGAAYRELVRRHGARLRHYAERLTHSAAEADDVVQETFLRLWQRASDYSPEARATTWLFRIAHNLCVDRLRARKPTDTLGDDDALPVSARQPELLDEKRRALALERALAALPERQAAAIALVYTQGFSGAEAARVLGVSDDALESLLSRGRRALKLLLASEEER